MTLIPYQPVDPDDQPFRAELGESREDTRDYHDSPPDPEIARLFWTPTDPPCFWDKDDPEGFPF